MSTPDLFHLLTKIHNVIKPGKKSSFGSVRPFRLSKDITQEFCIAPNILKHLHRFEVCFQSNNFLYMQYAAEVLYIQMVWHFLHKVAPCCTLSLHKGTYVFDRHIWLLSNRLIAHSRAMQSYFKNVDFMLEGGQHYFGMESLEYPF